MAAKLCLRAELLSIPGSEPAWLATFRATIIGKKIQPVTNRMVTSEDNLAHHKRCSKRGSKMAHNGTYSCFIFVFFFAGNQPGMPSPVVG
jgi:hypothetical protein